VRNQGRPGLKKLFDYFYFNLCDPCVSVVSFFFSFATAGPVTGLETLREYAFRLDNVSESLAELAGER